MATKRSYTKKKKSNDPSYKRRVTSTHTAAERFLRFQVAHPGNSGETSHYIDIAKELSKLNRRMYRQGKVYRVANISVTSRNTVDGLISFSTAPDTWVSRNSWIRGFELWNQMNKKVLDGQPARKSQWHDFKVYLSDSHRTAAAARKPGVLDNGNNSYGNGEWVYSEFISPDGTTSTDAFKAHLVGDHNGTPGAWTSVSLIRSYAEARASVQASVPLIDSGGDDDPLLNLFDDGTQVDEIAQNLDSYGDVPPYAWDATDVGENYPGSSLNGPKPIVRRLAAIGTADTGTGPLQNKGVAAPTVMLPGFDALCGVIEIETQSSTKDGVFFPEDDIFDVVIELAPGNYKGVAAFDI
mgnify:CR=1 FL=1|jgi:hypothetical protein